MEAPPWGPDGETHAGAVLGAGNALPLLEVVGTPGST